MTRTKYLIRKAITDVVSSPAPFKCGCSLGRGQKLFIEKRQNGKVVDGGDNLSAWYRLILRVVGPYGRKTPTFEIEYRDILQDVDRKEFVEKVTDWLLEAYGDLYLKDNPRAGFDNPFRRFLEADDECVEEVAK